MRDQEEQARIREQYLAEQGKGTIVEQLMGERENALDTGDDSAVIRVEDQLATLGYKTPEQRENAAAARRADAERRAREEQRIEANRGAAAARDDGQGGPDVQRADKPAEPPKDDGAKEPPRDDAKGARRQAPAGRQSKSGSQQKG